MASVRKLRPGDAKSPWVVEYTDGTGKRRRKTPKSGLKKDADALRQQVEREMNQGVHTPNSDGRLTLKMLSDEFIKDCERRRVLGDLMTQTTLKGYKNFALNHIAREFGTKTIAELTIEGVEEWLLRLAKTKAPKTVIRARLVLKLMIDLAIRRKWCARNIIIDGKIAAPANVTRREMLIPSEDQVRRIIEVAAQRGFRGTVLSTLNRSAAVRLALFCGLRAGEVAGLDWPAIDFENRTIRIRQSFSRHDGVKSPKTEAGKRALPMPEPVREALQELKNVSRMPLAGPVLLSRTGERYSPSEIWRLWEVAAVAAGCKGVRFHDLRHTAISAMIDAKTLSPLHIKNFAGHAKTSTTFDIYGHLFPSDNAIAVTADIVAERFAARQKRDDPSLSH